MPQQQMSPIDRYRYDIEHNGFSEDAAQLNAVEHLQRLYEELIAWNNYQQLPALKRWLSKAPVKPKLKTVTGKQMRIPGMKSGGTLRKRNGNWMRK